jgi:hypothetical protein
LDGKDISHVLYGTGVRDPDGHFKYLYLRPDSYFVGAYREGPWKLKVSGGSMGYPMDTLFDLEISPQEGLEDDLSAFYPQELDTLWIGLQQLEAEVVPLLKDGFESGTCDKWSDTSSGGSSFPNER